MSIDFITNYSFVYMIRFNENIYLINCKCADNFTTTKMWFKPKLFAI